MYIIYYYNIYIYIYISYKNTITCGVSSKLHLWFSVWVLLAALSVNFQGKYLFFNWKVTFIFEMKLAYCFN